MDLNRPVLPCGDAAPVRMTPTGALPIAASPALASCLPSYRILPLPAERGASLSNLSDPVFGNRTAMPTIGRIGPLSVMIFRNDHDPPHFHVIGADFSAKFTIADLTLLSGNGRLRRWDIRAIEQRGQRHKYKPYLNWDVARAGQPSQRIED